MNFLISKEVKALLTPLSESPMMQHSFGQYLTEAEEDEDAVDATDAAPIDGEDEDESKEQEETPEVDPDAEPTDAPDANEEPAEVAPPDPNVDVSIYGDLTAERMLNMYKSCCSIYDLLEDAKRTVLVLMKRPEFFMAASRINQELDIVIPEIRNVMDSDFNPTKSQVYANIIAKFDAYIKALRLVFTDIENQIKSKDE